MTGTEFWHDDDTLWREMAPAMFTEERWRDAEIEAASAVKLAAIPEKASILDLACGPGRHSLALAKLGYGVVGVDRTRAYLDEAKSRAAANELDVEWVCADMREFVRPHAFDAAICMLTSFGFFEDVDEDRRVAANMLSSLKHGGVLVMELMGKEVLARIFRARDWNALPDGSLFLEERLLAADWSRLDVRWILIKAEQRFEHRFSLRPYSAEELKGLLHHTGFVDVKAFGSLDGTPYDSEAQRLVVVARKGKEEAKYVAATAAPACRCPPRRMFGVVGVPPTPVWVDSHILVVGIHFVSPCLGALGRIPCAP